MTNDALLTDPQVPRFDSRMSEAEGLMWRMEKDPFLASTFGNVTVLDRPINFSLFRERMQRATIAVPRLRQRVRPTPAALGAPRWVDDPEFNIDYHVRRMSLPTPGTQRQLLDLATLIINDPFERTRPLWQFVIVEGLEGGCSALIQKLHHTVTDGQGGVALSMQFLDLTRDAPQPPEMHEPADDASHQSAAQAAGEVLSSSFNDVMRTPLAL
ncbi:MAG: hypothetical protein EBV41_05285, partial [Actinobacteria bacterium]|nr:hypothetical protein [Actinomycetota bacterium]